MCQFLECDMHVHGCDFVNPLQDVWFVHVLVATFSTTPNAIGIERGRSTAATHLMCLVAKRAYGFVDLDEVVSFHHGERINSCTDLAAIFLCPPRKSGCLME